LILGQLLQGIELDFFHLCSSLASLLPTPGSVAYAAANAFLDAFAADKALDTLDNRITVTSINWDMWQDIGIAVKGEEKHRELLDHEMDKGITAQEGIVVFSRLLANPLPRVVVSTTDLKQRIERYNYFEVSYYKEQAEEIGGPKFLQQRSGLDVPYEEPGNEMEEKLAEIFQDFLGIDHIGIHDNFFDLGVTSLDLIQINRKIDEVFAVKIPLVKLMTYTTIHSFAGYFVAEVSGNRHTGKEILEMDIIKRRKEILKQRLAAAQKQKKQTGVSSEIPEAESPGGGIAVIGMAGRFPGAKNLDEFWENLQKGVESIWFFSQDELEESGIDPQLIKNPDYVKAKGLLENSQYFDALFFDYNAREAETMDPQTRIFHECAWEALEYAGYDPYSYPGLIGLYAGAAPHPYWDMAKSVLKMKKTSEIFSSMILSDKDYFTTRIAYKLNLKGTAFAVSTACSTSLVAVHLAYDNLLSGGCDMALAGGVSIGLPEKMGYFYEEGMILSEDGHNRSFDQKASGSNFSDGVGVVLLKQLKDALVDRDTIHAVIKGSATNNDGNRKLGYTAPSVEGQAQVIKTALEMAEVEPETIGYLEAHGTATPLGDDVEIESLNRVFHQVKRKNFCAVGSVKSNVGHLNSAAGIAGLIKTVLALKHQRIPPSLHFEQCNPRIDFENSPFYLNNQLIEWKRDGYPRRAGVSSFGIGGTNAHVVLEEAPQDGKSVGKDRGKEKNTKMIPQGKEAREYQLILLSAQTQSALDKGTENFMNFLKENPGINLSDAAYTLQVGRKHFLYRKMLVCQHSEEVIEALSSPGLGKVFTFNSKEQSKTVVFMFPGQGSQYIHMGEGLYRSEPVFREEMDRCFDIFKSLTGQDIKEILYPSPVTHHPSPDINRTEFSQPVIFMFEYALAKLLMSWGIKPGIMIGYSFGEYAAACISGVLSLEDAVKLIALRGRLMQQMPQGAMLSVPVPMKELKPLLNNKQLSIAIDNGSSCIVSGTCAAIDTFEKRMKEKRYLCTRLSVTHASHSVVMAPILSEFEKEVRKIKLKEPQIPYISNVTGEPISGSEVTDPLYWVKHLKDTVRFGDGISELLKIPHSVFVEVGPGRDLGVLLKGHKDYDPSRRTINLVRHGNENQPDLYYLLNRIGHLWFYGIHIDWQGFHANKKRYRIALPTYSFEGQCFAVEDIPLKSAAGLSASQNPLQKKADIGDWFYMPLWKRSRIPGATGIAAASERMHMLLFMDEVGLGDKIEKQLKQQGYLVSIVRIGKEFKRLNEFEYAINPSVTNDYEALFHQLNISGSLPAAIVHLWGITSASTSTANESSGFEWVEKEQDKGFHSLIALVQTLGKQSPDNHFHVKVVSDNVFDVTGGEVICPEKATLLGPVNGVAHEYNNISCCIIDVVLPAADSRQEQQLLEHLVREFTIKIQDQDQVAAYRNGFRWVQTFEPVQIGKTANSGLREKGVYLITGGLGGVGLILAQHLAEKAKAKLILTRRSNFPSRENWDDWLAANGDTGDKENEKISRIIRKIREIEASGAEVMVFCADVLNYEQMQQVIRLGEQSFGKINGVIHAAGVPDGAMIMRRTREMSESVLAAKVTGTLVLEKVLAESEPDFFVLCSSIASILSLPGQCAYAAANAFLDAFAASRTLKNGITPIAINWDRWQNLGMSIITEKEYTELLGEEIETGMTSPEGIDVFDRILADTLPQVVVSTTDLKARMERYYTSNFLSNSDIFKEKAGSKTIHKRPELSVEYVEPKYETEQKLSEVWQKYLGIDRVGIHDNFFDLGATSLDIIQVNNRLKEVFARDIPLVTMYSYPTIALMVQFLNQEKVGDDFFAHEQRSFDAKDKAQKKMKNLKTRKKKGEHNG
jgi:acyl transferase domain-containing protein/acyl carrier protein